MYTTYSTYYISLTEPSSNKSNSNVGSVDMNNLGNLNIGWKVATGVATGIAIVNIIIPIVSVVVFLIACIVLLFMYALKQRMVHGRLRYVLRKSTKKWRCFRGRPRSYSSYLAHKAEKERKKQNNETSVPLHTGVMMATPITVPTYPLNTVMPDYTANGMGQPQPYNASIQSAPFYP